MTLYSLGVLIFAIRELSSGLAMSRQSRNAALDSPHTRALGTAGVLRGFYDGSGTRIAQGFASVTVGRGLARVLLRSWA